MKVYIQQANRSKNGQWQAGQSGNPKGRPRKGTELAQSVLKVLTEELTTTSADGRKARLGAVEAPFLALCNKALKGNDVALVKAFTILLGVIPAKDLYFQPGPELEDHEESLRKIFEELWALDAEISASAIRESVPDDMPAGHE